MWPKLQRWRGVILVSLAVSATLWLAIAGELVLYIHPRYIVFTIIMAVLAVGFVVASACVRPHASHDSDEGADVPIGRWPKLLTLTAVGLATALAVSMVALPATTLTSATAQQRDINSTVLDLGTTDVASVTAGSAGAFETFSVVDWASLLRQTSDLSFFANKPVVVSGFITADPEDPENLFYVARFVVTCCAVDAQPVGVPVYAPNWRSSFKIDDWVEVRGEFATNPSQSSKQPLAVDPSDITPIEQPREPYLF